MVFSYIALEALKRRGIIDVPTWSPTAAKILVPLALFYLGNVASALTALRLTSVPVYNVLKRVSPLPVMLIDWVLRGQGFSFNVQVSVLAIVVGAMITGSGDLDLNVTGYGFAILSCALQALYLVCASKAHDIGMRTRTCGPPLQTTFLHERFV